MPQKPHPARDLGSRVASLREHAGLTQWELGRMLGVTQSAVSRMESGERQLSAAQLIQLAHILGVGLAALTQAEDSAAAVDASREGTQGRSLQASRDAPQSTTQPLRDDIVRGPGGLDSAAAHLAALAFFSDTPGRETPASAASWPETSVEAAMFAPQPADHREPQALALEPAPFAEVVADALDLEDLAARHGLPPATRVSWAERRVLGPLSPEPAQAARFWRHELGVGIEGPLPDLVMLLEEAGVYVVHARLDEQVPAGACAEVTSPAFPSVSPRTPSSRTPDPSSAAAPLVPFVFVNGARPVVLQRFALAHEFAHLALGHRDAYDERIDWSGRSGREVSANAFAEELTAPSAAVRRWFEARGEPEVDVELVVDLANHFGISFWAARYRLRTAGRLPTRRLRELDDRLRRQEWELIPRQTFLGGLRDTLSVLTAESRCDAERQSDQRRGPERGSTGTPGAEGRDTAEQGANLLRMAPRGVRVPARMRALALALLQRGVISLEQAATFLRFDVPSLREQTARLGL